MAVREGRSGIVLSPVTGVDEVGALARLAARTAGANTVVDVFHAVYDEVKEVIEAPVFLLALYDEPSRTIEVVRQIDRGTELNGGSFPLGSGFTSRAIIERRPILIRDWSKESQRIQLLYGTETDRLIRPLSALTLPMMAGERALGVLSVQSYRAEAYGDPQLAFMQTVSALAAHAIERMHADPSRDAEMARRNSELEAILSYMTDALLILDRDGMMRRLNRAARELLSLAPGEIVMGASLTDRPTAERAPFRAHEVAEALAGMFERLRGGEDIDEREVELRTGALRVLSFSASALRDPDGSFQGAVIVFRDVTSAREIERLKGEMLSIAWHDLRTPLTAIKGQAQLLKRYLDKGKTDLTRLKDSLNVIDRQADRLHERIDTLLDLSGIQLGRLQLDRRPTDLVEVVSSVVETMRAATDRHPIRVQGTEAVVGPWDGRRLRQVVENLIANAVKYSPDGGEIDVEVLSDGGSATVRVTDRGMGLAPDELGHVFDRGYRGERARRLMTGAGLGLYICKAIVAAHGGRVWAESAGPGTGSTLAFTIPAGLIDV